jgi:hypothetical protein
MLSAEKARQRLDTMYIINRLPNPLSYSTIPDHRSYMPVYPIVDRNTFIFIPDIPFRMIDASKLPAFLRSLLMEFSIKLSYALFA